MVNKGTLDSHPILKWVGKTGTAEELSSYWQENQDEAIMVHALKPEITLTFLSSKNCHHSQQMQFHHPAK